MQNSLLWTDFKVNLCYLFEQLVGIFMLFFADECIRESTIDAMIFDMLGDIVSFEEKFVERREIIQIDLTEIADLLVESQCGFSSLIIVTSCFPVAIDSGQDLLSFFGLDLRIHGTIQDSKKRLYIISQTP